MRSSQHRLQKIFIFLTTIVPAVLLKSPLHGAQPEATLRERVRPQLEQHTQLLMVHDFMATPVKR